MNLLKDRLRPLYVPMIESSPTLRIMSLMAAPRMKRTTEFVKDGYEDTWGVCRRWLEQVETLDDWLYIKGYDDAHLTHQLDGRLVRRQPYDFNALNGGHVARALSTHFPRATSIIEYGCGVGRNLLRLKRQFPHLRCYGYELAAAGVEIARDAATKFGLEVEYAQLDYINGSPKDFVFGERDVAFTMFSLEQVPYANLIAVKNMLDRARLGSIHLEPVSENYPLNYRGLLGRLYSQRVNYLKNFDGGVRSLALKAVHKEVLNSAHNPLMYPTLYTLVK